MAGAFRDIDRGFAALLRRMSKNGGFVTVGIHDDDGSQAHADSGGLTVADVGMFHELGTVRTPQRSFIAGWADETEDRRREELKVAALAVVKGVLPSYDVALERLGSRWKAEVQLRMSQGIPPELHPYTIERKGSSVPLIDKGQLRAAIDYRVE